MADTRAQSRALTRERTIWIFLIILAFLAGISAGHSRKGEDLFQGLNDRDPIFGN